MAVQDDLRRLSEMQGIYLGLNLYGAVWLGTRAGCNKQMTAVGYSAQVVEMARLWRFSLGLWDKVGIRRKVQLKALQCIGSLLRSSPPKIPPSPSDKCSCGSSYRKESLTKGFRIQIDGCRANAMMRGRPYPLRAFCYAGERDGFAESICSSQSSQKSRGRSLVA